MTTTIANDKHYDAVAKQHAQNPDGFVGATLKRGESARTAANPDIVAASGKGVPAKAVAAKAC